MHITQLLYYGILCVSVLLSVSVTVITYIKGRKRKQNAIKNGETIGEVTESDTRPLSRRIIDALPSWIVSAEQFYNSIVPNSMQKTGGHKLAYVLDKVKMDCLTHNEEYDENSAISEIEKLIDMTKQVNIK